MATAMRLERLSLSAARLANCRRNALIFAAHFIFGLILDGHRGGQATDYNHAKSELEFCHAHKF